MTEAGATGVGAELTRAREAQGLALADVGQQLKFAPRQLEALEQERFEALPGPTIARGMLRNYARLLKLDPEALLERLGERLDAPDSDRLAARFRQPVPFSDSARRSTVIYVGMSLVVLAAVAAAGYQWREERSAARELAFVAAAKAPLEPARALPIPARMPTATARPPARKPAPVPEAKSEPSVERESEKPLAAVAPAAVAPAAIAPAAVEPAVEPVARAGMRRLVLRCEEESWIEVRDSLDRLLAASLNPAGTLKVVEGFPPFSLVIGNAHHVQLTYGGEPVDLQPHIRVEVARFTLE